MIEKLQTLIDELKESDEIKSSREKSLTITKLEEANLEEVKNGIAEDGKGSDE